MAKRNEIAKKVVDVEAGTVTFNFADEGVPVVIELSGLSDAKQQRAALHGISQVAGDSYAGAESVSAARESVLGVQERLYDDAIEWSARGTGEPRTAVLAECIARAQGISIEQATAGLVAIDAADKKLAETDAAKGAVRKALSAHPAIKKARAEIALERATAELANAPALAF